jgi:membrane protein required for colicin V production
MSNAEFFNLLDYIYIAILFLSTVAGFVRGFVRDFFSTCAWFGSGFAAVLIAPHLVPFLGKIIHNLTIARCVATLVSYLAILIISLLIIGAASKNVKCSPLSGVDRAVGVLFGLFRGAGVLVCFCFLMAMFEIPRNRYAIIENSKITAILFDIFSPWIQQTAKSTAIPKGKKTDSLEKEKLPIKKSLLKEKDKSAAEPATQDQQSSMFGGIKDFIKQQANDENTNAPHSNPAIVVDEKQKDNSRGSSNTPALRRKKQVRKPNYPRIKKVKKRKQ